MGAEIATLAVRVGALERCLEAAAFGPAGYLGEDHRDVTTERRVPALPALPDLSALSVLQDLSALPALPVLPVLQDLSASTVDASPPEAVMSVRDLWSRETRAPATRRPAWKPVWR